MPLRPSRVAKAAVVTAAVKPGPSPVAKAAVVGAAVVTRPRRRSPRLPSSARPSRPDAGGSSSPDGGTWCADCAPGILKATAAPAHRRLAPTTRRDTLG